METRWVKLGLVGKAHGLGGAFFIFGRSESLSRSVRNIRVGSRPDCGQAYTVADIRQQNGRSIMTCKELTSREALESLKGQEIWCQRSELSLDESREYIWADLIGKKLSDSKGQVLGEIALLENHGASDIVLVRDPRRGELAIPMVASYFDMNFKSEDPVIYLRVEAAIFDEAWQIV